MNSSKRYTEEFKLEAIKQVTERGYSVADVAERLGATTNSMYGWLKRYGDQSPQQVDKAKKNGLREEWHLLKRKHLN